MGVQLGSPRDTHEDTPAARHGIGLESGHCRERFHVLSCTFLYNAIDSRSLNDTLTPAWAWVAVWMQLRVSFSQRREFRSHTFPESTAERSINAIRSRHHSLSCAKFSNDVRPSGHLYYLVEIHSHSTDAGAADTRGPSIETRNERIDTKRPLPCPVLIPTNALTWAI